MPNVATLAGYKQRVHAEEVPAGAAVPTCAASKTGVGGLHQHAHQQAWGAQLHLYVHRHMGAGACADASVACGMRWRVGV